MDQPPRPDTGPPSGTPAGRQPVLRVVRGNPTDQELAALVSVLLGRAAVAARTAPSPGPPRPSRWRAALTAR
jgi:hypothetical protein